MLIRVPPPLAFLASYLLGMALQRVAPIELRADLVVNAGRIAGAAAVVLGALLAVSCALLFVVRRTTMIPFGSASHLITAGPYRISRNPMYVSVTLMYLGAAGVFSQIWPALLVPLPLLFLNAIVIPFEEARLKAIFGPEYAVYCARVRRWL